jgi:hypothetical protein
LSIILKIKLINKMNGAFIHWDMISRTHSTYAIQELSNLG